MYVWIGFYIVIRLVMISYFLCFFVYFKEIMIVLLIEKVFYSLGVNMNSRLGYIVMNRSFRCFWSLYIFMYMIVSF